MNDARIHTVSCLAADEVMEALRPLLAGSEFARAWFRVYWAVRAGVEVYEIDLERRESKAVPSMN